MNSLVFGLGLVGTAFAITGFVALAAAGGFLERKARKAEEGGRLGKAAKAAALLLFMVLCLSIVPLLLGFAEFALRETMPADIRILEENDTLIVLAFWLLTIFAVLIALPQIRKGLFG